MKFELTFAEALEKMARGIFCVSEYAPRTAKAFKSGISCIFDRDSEDELDAVPLYDQDRPFGLFEKKSNWAIWEKPKMVERPFVERGWCRFDAPEVKGECILRLDALFSSSKDANSWGSAIKTFILFKAHPLAVPVADTLQYLPFLPMAGV